MALRLGRCCRTLLNEPCTVGLFPIYQSGWMGAYTGAKRHLLSEDIIRLQDFRQKKLSVAHLANGKYVQRFKKKLHRNELILRKDLKLLLHLCQSQEDMVVARDAIYRYHTENPNMREVPFNFGPLFVRLCYEMGLHDMAFTVLTDQSMRGFFRGPTSFNITLDMLFKKGSYDSALELLMTMRKQRVIFNRDTLILAGGTCYKLNTPESYRICISLMDELQNEGRIVPRHALCFAVGLALRQNDPQKAQSLYIQIIGTDSVLCQNLHIALLAMSGQMRDAISALSAALMPESPSFVKKLQVSQELLDALSSWNENGPYEKTLENIVTRLKQANQVTEMTLDYMLCQAEMPRQTRPSRLLQSNVL